MSNQITLTGRLTADPELRFTPNGKAVAIFTVADDYGHRDRSTNEWVKDGSTFLPVEVWGHHAESCTENLRKGQRVVVVGEVRQRSYETREGEKRHVYEVKNVSEVGQALDKWQPRGAVDGGRRAPASKQQDDPWGSAPAQSSYLPDDEPPF